MYSYRVLLAGLKVVFISLSKTYFCEQQENRDPQQAFRLWLKKKHEEQLKRKKDRRTAEARGA